MLSTGIASLWTSRCVSMNSHLNKGWESCLSRKEWAKYRQSALWFPPNEANWAYKNQDMMPTHMKINRFQTPLQLLFEPSDTIHYVVLCMYTMGMCLWYANQKIPHILQFSSEFQLRILLATPTFVNWWSWKGIFFEEEVKEDEEEEEDVDHVVDSHQCVLITSWFWWEQIWTEDLWGLRSQPHVSIKSWCDSFTGFAQLHNRSGFWCVAVCQSSIGMGSFFQGGKMMLLVNWNRKGIKNDILTIVFKGLKHRNKALFVRAQSDKFVKIQDMLKQ